jgi:hypothetical protein
MTLSQPQVTATPFGELNSVLAELVVEARRVLGDNFQAAYLQGSFALGDFDEHSDADFMIVTRRDISEAELPALQALHERLHALPNPWARRLEGSYAPAALLRNWSTTPRDPPGEPRPDDWADPETGGRPPRVYPFWFLNNGASALVRSEHDNTQVVRWVLREKGLTLAGPPAATLIEPVSAEALQAEAAETLQHLGVDLLAKSDSMGLRWQQAFMALAFARMLHTLETGLVVSKRAAVTWATENLRNSWASLIEHAWQLRHNFADSWQDPADPVELTDTMALLRYALEVASARSKT